MNEVTPKTPRVNALELPSRESRSASALTANASEWLATRSRPGRGDRGVLSVCPLVARAPRGSGVGGHRWPLTRSGEALPRALGALRGSSGRERVAVGAPRSAIPPRARCGGPHSFRGTTRAGRVLPELHGGAS